MIDECRICGCTWDNACITDHGPCWWVEADLCSACVEKIGDKPKYEYRAWNRALKIMCYDNEDNSADYFDGIESSEIGLINHRLAVPESDCPYTFRNNYDVMRYVGILDKNNTKVFEDDNVKYSRIQYTDCSRSEVEIRYPPIEGKIYYAEGLWLGIKQKDGTGYLFQPGEVRGGISNGEIEVIGNVYEDALNV